MNYAWESSFYVNDGYVKENHRNIAVIEKLEGNEEYSSALQYLYLHSNLLNHFFREVGHGPSEFDISRMEQTFNRVVFNPEIIKLSLIEKFDFMFNKMDRQILDKLHHLNRNYPVSFNTVLFTYDKHLMGKGIISFVYIVRPLFDAISIHHDKDLYFLAEENLRMISSVDQVSHLKKELIDRFYSY